jgi:hypothetical protein
MYFNSWGDQGILPALVKVLCGCKVPHSMFRTVENIVSEGVLIIDTPDNDDGDGDDDDDDEGGGDNDDDDDDLILSKTISEFFLSFSLSSRR